ncbi:MAG: sel1 repeat family protein [Clostridia bacterium]|nr:sel1 repeat family protein [Clostridia bacterium]
MYEKLVADVKFLEGDYKTAAQMYLEGAREGDALASFNYGYCLWRGYGVERDPYEAKSFFAFSREMEGGEACYNLAMLYLHGDKITKDYKKALEYMTLSANQGCIEAQLYLGMAYTSGCMFEPDVVGICMIPAHKPEYRAMYAELEGFVPDIDEFERDEDLRYSAVKQDGRAAFEWFQTAARHDPTYVEELVAKGKYLYARCYVDGLGTDFDRDKSIRLMALAGKAGSAEALLYFQENGITAEMISGITKPKKLTGGKRS